MLYRYCDEETFLLSDQAPYAANPDRYEREEDYAAVFGQMVLEMSDALTMAYIGRHDMSKERQEMLDFFEEIRAVYRGMLEKEDWLSDATREKAIEKLNGMKLFALYPDHFKDFTGVQAIMELAKTKEGFDYDKFFRTYAEAHAFYSSYKRDLSILGDDSHPLDYLRTNVVVQQFDEFMETYDVKEGDGMYLAPEDRITIW